MDKVAKLQKEKQELAKKCNDLEQKLNAIYSRNQDPDITTMYHQLEDRYSIVLESLKEARSRISELEKKLESQTETITVDSELEYRYETLLEDLKYERSQNKILQERLKALSPTSEPVKEKPIINKEVKREKGRPKKVNEEVINRVIELKNEGKTVRGIASTLALSVGTVSRIIKEHA